MAWLFNRFVVGPIHQQRLRSTGLARWTQTPRLRSVGAGHRHRHNLCDRLLMTLLWLQVYRTYRVPAFQDLDKASEDDLGNILATLEMMTTFNFQRPRPERAKSRTPQAVMETAKTISSPTAQAS